MLTFTLIHMKLERVLIILVFELLIFYLILHENLIYYLYLLSRI